MSDMNEFEEEAAAAGLEEKIEKPGIAELRASLADVDLEEFFRGFDLESLREPTQALRDMNEMYDTVRKAHVEGKTVAELMNVGADQIEVMYGMAFMAYQVKRVREAANLFQQLSILNPHDFRFSFGLGSCYKAMGMYQAAIIPFMMAAGLDVANSSSCWYAAECVWMTGEMHPTVEMLEEAVRRSRTDPSGDKYGDLAKAMLENIENGAVPPKPGSVHTSPEPEPEPKAKSVQEEAQAMQTAGGGRRRFKI